MQSLCRHDCENITKLENFLVQFPNCTYEKYVHSGLGEIYYKKATPTVKGRYDKDWLGKAIDCFSEVISAQEHPFQADATFYAGMCCYHLKDYENAEKYFVEVVESRDYKTSANAARKLKSIKLFRRIEKEKEQRKEDDH